MKRMHFPFLFVYGQHYKFKVQINSSARQEMFPHKELFSQKIGKRKFVM